jgi:hypothetical protein
MERGGDWTRLGCQHGRGASSVEVRGTLTKERNVSIDFSSMKMIGVDVGSGESKSVAAYFNTDGEIIDVLDFPIQEKSDKRYRDHVEKDNGRDSDENAYS